MTAPATIEPKARPALQLPSYAPRLFEPHRYKVLYGGRGGARSWTVARILLLKAAAESLRVLCTREMQSSLRDSVHQLLRDQIKIMDLPGFEVTDREIRHANGSLFLFEGLRHNIDQVKSLEGIDVCWVEEAERISARSWRVLIPTIRKLGSEIWVTFNPDLESDATYQRFIVNPPKDALVIKVSWHDNPWFSGVLRDEKDYDYRVDAEAADHTWEGNLRKVSAATILRGKWKVEDFVVPQKADGEYLWDGPYQGMDFGFGSDPFATVRLWVFADCLYVEHEVWALQLDLDETCGHVNSIMPADYREHTIRADSARPDSISHLRKYEPNGFERLKGAKKGPGSVADGISHLRHYKWIIIHTRCKHFEAEAKNYSYKVDEKSGDILPIPVDKHNHLIDASRYALEPLIKPQRLSGILFGEVEAPPVCPECESKLDEGSCPVCGWYPELETDPVVPRPEVAKAIAATNGNGNGNGPHANGDGEGSSDDEKYNRLRSLND